MGEEIKIFSDISIRLNIPIDEDNLKMLITFYETLSLRVGDEAFEKITRHDTLWHELNAAIPKEERTEAYQERIDCHEAKIDLYKTWGDEIQAILWKLERELRNTLKERKKNAGTETSA